MSSPVVRAPRREHGEHNGCDDEGEAVSEVAENQGPATAGVVDEKDGGQLGHKGDDGGNALVFEGVVRGDAHAFEDDWGVVLDSGDAGHLDRGLNRAAEEETAELFHVVRPALDPLK